MFREYLLCLTSPVFWLFYLKAFLFLSIYKTELLPSCFKKIYVTLVLWFHLGQDSAKKKNCKELLQDGGKFLVRAASVSTGRQIMYGSGWWCEDGRLMLICFCFGLLSVVFSLQAFGGVLNNLSVSWVSAELVVGSFLCYVRSIQVAWITWTWQVVDALLSGCRCAPWKLVGIYVVRNWYISVTKVIEMGLALN